MDEYGDVGNGRGRRIDLEDESEDYDPTKAAKAALEALVEATIPEDAEA